jgi:hypothetical protein
MRHSLFEQKQAVESRGRKVPALVAMPERKNPQGSARTARILKREPKPGLPAKVAGVADREEKEGDTPIEYFNHNNSRDLRIRKLSGVKPQNLCVKW